MKMDKELQKLKIPQVGEFVRPIGKLINIEVVQPPPPKPETNYIFEEIEARCELRLNDEVLKHLGTLNDFYGLETSVESAIKEMKEYVSSRNINKNSDLEVVVIRKAYQIRKRPIDRYNIFSKEYHDFEFIEHGATLNLPKPIETIAWSSKGDEGKPVETDPSENEEAK